MELALAAVIAVGALIFAFSFAGRARKAQGVDDPPKKRLSKREKKLEQLRQYDPLPEPKAILDIVREEAEDLGVNDVPGGEGLEIPVKLKVWHRDEAIREACDGDVRYEVAADVPPAEATVDDVRLVGADGLPRVENPAPAPAGIGTTDDDAPIGDTTGEAEPTST